MSVVPLPDPGAAALDPELDSELDRSLDRALEEARGRYREARPRSLAAHQAASHSLPGGNTRSVLWHGPFPLRLHSGRDAELVDADGHRYINLLGEYSAGLFGHSHPVIRRAIDQALDGGISFGGHNLLEVELARLVVARFPALQRVRFTNSGTEANLMAVSTARQATGRAKVMVFSGGYHGGLLAFAGAGSPLNAPFDYLIGRYNDDEAASRLIRGHASDLACVLVEAMQGSAGCIPAEPAFLKRLEDEARSAGALLILDEVMTSRFGAAGAHAMLGLRPDLITLGKWVGGGMSFGAFGGRADLMAAYDPARPGALPHAGTFNNNVLSMAAGVAAVGEVFTAEVAAAHHARGDRLRRRLNEICDEAGACLQATGIGSLLNLHPIRGPVQRAEDLSVCDPRRRELLFLDLLERGFYLAPRGFIALTLAVTDEQEGRFVAALRDVLMARRGVL